MSKVYEVHCSPCDVADFEANEMVTPKLKSQILMEYAPGQILRDPNTWEPLDSEGNVTHDPAEYVPVPFFSAEDVATNAKGEAFRYGVIDGNSADEINVINVEAIDEDAGPVWFDLAMALAALPDVDTLPDPSVISGYPVHLCFSGGSMDDVATGGTFADEFFGFAGMDTFNGGRGNDLLDGGKGADTLNGDEGDDVILGGRGRDIINGGDGDDKIDGGKGRDTIDGGEGDNFIEGGVGNDSITAMDGNNTIYGNEMGGGRDKDSRDRDVITTGDGDDQIYGQEGNDTIDAGDGDNEVSGGKGDDRIDTGEGNDKVRGGGDDDMIKTNGGDDEVDGGGGDDTIVTGEGDDTAVGGNGDDNIMGEQGDDVLAGEEGDDVVDGGGGNDKIFINEGKDIVTGGQGDDIFSLSYSDQECEPVYQDEYGYWPDLGTNLITDFSQRFHNEDTIDMRCLDNLTHLTVNSIDDDYVILRGYADINPYDYKDYFTDGASLTDEQLIFTLHVEGENVGTNNSASGILQQDTAYNVNSGPVLLNAGVLVDLGIGDDGEAPAWYVV